MSVDPTVFSDFQLRALFDLLILAMYADGHLTTFEDERLQNLFSAMGCTEKIDRQREFDTGVERMRPAVQSIQKAKNQALLLAEAFTTRGQQKQVHEAVEQLMAADNHVSSWESILLMELRMKYRI